jgi:hypothetical protein
MNEHDRLDLSPLDPLRDPAHWRSVVDATLVRVDAVLARRPQDPLSLIASWTRPLLVATLVALAVLVPVELALEMREARAGQVERLVELSADWRHGEPPPSGSDFLRALVEERQP